MQTHRAAVHFPSRAVVGRHMAAQGDITRRVSGAQRAGMLQCALRAHLSPRSPRPSTRHSVGRGSPCGTRRLNLNARKARERPLCRSAPRASEAALRLRRRSSAAAPQRHWSRCGRSSVGAGRQQMMTLLREQCRICSGADAHLLGSRCTSAPSSCCICSDQWRNCSDHCSEQWQVAGRHCSRAVACARAPEVTRRLGGPRRLGGSDLPTSTVELYCVGFPRRAGHRRQPTSTFDADHTAQLLSRRCSAIEFRLSSSVPPLLDPRAVLRRRRCSGLCRRCSGKNRRAAGGAARGCCSARAASARCYLDEIRSPSSGG